MKKIRTTLDVISKFMLALSEVGFSNEDIELVNQSRTNRYARALKEAMAQERKRRITFNESYEISVPQTYSSSKLRELFGQEFQNQFNEIELGEFGFVNESSLNFEGGQRYRVDLFEVNCHTSFSCLKRDLEATGGVGHPGIEGLLLFWLQNSEKIKKLPPPNSRKDDTETAFYILSFNENNSDRTPPYSYIKIDLASLSQSESESTTYVLKRSSYDQSAILGYGIVFQKV